jgi:hypothetical protein
LHLGARLGAIATQIGRPFPVLDLTPLAHRSYLAEIERKAKPRPRAGHRPAAELAARAVAAARRLLRPLRVGEARRA